MPTVIAIEAKPVELRGIDTGFLHLYLVKTVTDEQGRVVARATVESEPAAIAAWLLGLGLRFGRIGLEAGPMSPWLYAGLVEADLPAVCVETRHMHAALSARINKMGCPGPTAAPAC